MVGRPKDITGQRFGKLVAIKLDHIDIKPKSTVHYWLCQCDCGNTKIIRKVDMLRGKIKSCGCITIENAKKRAKHNYFNTKPYHVWHDIKQRCLNPNNKAYKNYGGRGITICEEWKNPETFCKWSYANGYKEGLSIDRIDVNGNYEPSNCRWVDIKTQQRNKRTNNLLTINNITHCVTDWAEILGISLWQVKNKPIEYLKEILERSKNENRKRLD